MREFLKSVLEGFVGPAITDARTAEIAPSETDVRSGDYVVVFQPFIRMSDGTIIRANNIKIASDTNWSVTTGSVAAPIAGR